MRARRELTLFAAAVCSCAVTSLAGEYSYTGFEQLAAGASLDIARSDAGYDGDRYWGADDADGFYGAVSNHVDALALSVRDGAKSRYLQVDATRMLRRYANSSHSKFEPVNVQTTEGVYFDSLVRFTGTDAPLEFYAEDSKLEVWLYKSDLEDGVYGVGTNLVVRAGFFDSRDNHVVPMNYLADAQGISEGWHRLTIKMIPELGDGRTDYGFVGVVGFVVFVDGVPVTSTAVKGVDGSVLDSLNVTAARWHSAHALFPSLQNRATSEAQEFNYIGLRGDGAVDELLITANAPTFANDDRIFTLRWERGLASLTIDGARVDGFVEGEPGATNIVIASSSYRVEAVPRTGYSLGEWQASGRVSCQDGVFEVAGTGSGTVKVNQLKFQVQRKDDWSDFISFEEALDVAESGDTIRLAADIAECLNFEGRNLILDLAGHSIVYESVDDAVIYVSVDSELTVVDSVGGGRIVGGAAGSLYSDGKLSVGGVSGDAGVVFDGGALVSGNGELQIFKGRFLKAAYDLEALVAVKNPGTAITEDGAYYVATPGVVPVVPTAEPGWEDAETAHDGARASEVWESFPEKLAEADARQLATWAMAMDVAFVDADAINVEAFLLNCANTEAAIAAAKAAFKFESITPGEIPEIDGDYNGTISIRGSSDLENWDEAQRSDSFFMAVLGF